MRRFNTLSALCIFSLMMLASADARADSEAVVVKKNETVISKSDKDGAKYRGELLECAWLTIQTSGRTVSKAVSSLQKAADNFVKVDCKNTAALFRVKGVATQYSAGIEVSNPVVGIFASTGEYYYCCYQK